MSTGKLQRRFINILSAKSPIKEATNYDFFFFAQKLIKISENNLLYTKLESFG